MAHQKEDCFVVEGKLALPYQYFAGRGGSRFLIALRDEKKIMGLRCGPCNATYVPPRSVCDSCFAKLTEWVDVEPRGEVTGFTVIRHTEPHHPVQAPYILGLIKLDGATTPLAHVIQGIPREDIKIGLKVEAVFSKEPTNTIRDIDHFRPVVEKKAGENAGGSPAPGSPPPANEGPSLGYSYDELKVGMSASFSKTISESDVYLFAGITGDFNPVHVNEEFARQTPFGTRIAHGGLPQCLIAHVLGMQLPGLGTVALEVTTRFKKPTFFGDTITARAEISEKLPKKRWVKLKLMWTNQKGELVCEGTALVLPPPPLPR